MKALADEKGFIVVRPRSRFSDEAGFDATTALAVGERGTVLRLAL